MMKKLFVLLFIILCFQFLTHQAEASTTVGGDISSDTIWDISGSPYILNQEVRVTSGASLTISPGVTVENGIGKHPLDLGITVTDGKLAVLGTSDQRITFQNIYVDGTNASISISYADLLRVQVSTKSIVTIIESTLSSLSMVDSSVATVSDTTIDADFSPLALAPTYIQGRSILTFKNGHIRNTSTSGTALQTRDNVTVNLTNTVIEGGDIGVAVTVDSRVTLDGDIVKNAKKAGIYVEKHPTESWDHNELVVRNSQIIQNEHGVEIRNTPERIDISGNSFIGNTIAIYHTDPGKIIIGENWWNSSTGPKSTLYNPGGQGESISDLIVVSSWLMTDPFDNQIKIEKKNTPVIIIPGIAGSELFKKNASQTELWPNIKGVVTSISDDFLEYLAFDANGEEKNDNPVHVGDVIRSLSGVHIFDSLIDSLVSAGYVEGKDLFVFPYDWRHSVQEDALELKKMIANVTTLSNCPNVTLVAHSMGGLVAKQYIADEGDSLIDKLILLATPHLGSPKAFTMLEYGDNLGASILGFSLLNPKKIYSISQNMPSVYDLLPSKTYVDDPSHGLRYVQDLLGTYLSNTSSPYLDYAETKQLLISSGRNSNLFSQAEDMHAGIDSIPLPESKTYNYVGCGRTKTIGSITLRKKFAWTSTGRAFVDDYDLGYVNGDDTVPRTSASLSGTQQFFVKGASHSTIPSTSGVPESIQAVLSDHPEKAISQNVVRDTSACAIAGTLVSKHSPVRMDVYDASGNHTGPLVDGSIEYGIEGVSYDEVGEDAFVFLPSGATYTIVNTATDTGGYDLYVKKIAEDDTVTREYYFHDIPIVSVGDVSSLTISDEISDPEIHAGSGSDNQTIYKPSRVTSDMSAHDSVAPVSSANIADDGYVTLSASDVDSGVLETNYSTDSGTTWNRYENPFQAIGQTVNYFSIDAVGNVEDIKIITVPKKINEKNEIIDHFTHDTGGQQNSGPVQLFGIASSSIVSQEPSSKFIADIHRVDPVQVAEPNIPRSEHLATNFIKNRRPTNSLSPFSTKIQNEVPVSLSSNVQKSGFSLDYRLFIIGLCLFGCLCYFARR